ncbi:hypothetical protein LOD99_1660 [Oopsacas minuta]|uniref:C-type lectin domain-containing protein n=1 Tax=Oopsacas minuta TaxID=111878 RepID=A0AAV7K433_9METZ|nr:hypothetical protein LOD99_1660 [Oopsacas minuta]
MSRMLPLLLLLAFSANLNAVKICRESQALLFTENNLCYLLKDKMQSYAIAKSQCMALSDGNLVSIMTNEEDEFIKLNFTAEFPFWIGLSDISTEEEFIWEETGEPLASDYTNWENKSDNELLRNCVFYNTDKLWEIQVCSYSYSYLCKFESCNSNDGVYCVGEAPTTEPAGFDIVPIVVVLIILVIIVVIVVIVILVLFYLYKKQNDVWKRLCSCITFKQAKQKVHGLEQENFRLRKELGDLKHTSINLSGSQSLNKPRVISSIPDGQGGMLPSIRPVIPSSNAHPPIPVSPPGDPSKPGPPPLAQNTSLLQSSMNYSIRSQIVPTPLPQPNLNSSITSDQIAGILWSQKADFQVPKKPFMNSGQQRVPSRSLFQSPFPTTSTPFTFPNTGNLIASPLPNPSEALQINSTQDNIKKPTEKEESKIETEQDVPSVGEEKIPQEDKQ